ncbi:hypothetical protein [Streptomyces sp. NPDC001286]
MHDGMQLDGREQQLVAEGVAGVQDAAVRVEDLPEAAAGARRERRLGAYRRASPPTSPPWT